MDEMTEYAFPWDAKTWSIPTNGTKYYEALYTAAPLSRKDTISTPATLEVRDDLYLTLHEANLTDYASLNLTPRTNGQEESVTLRAALTPWNTGEKVFAHAPSPRPGARSSSAISPATSSSRG